MGRVYPVLGRLPKAAVKPGLQFRAEWKRNTSALKCPPSPQPVTSKDFLVYEGQNIKET